MIGRANSALKLFGLDLRKGLASIKNSPWFWRQRQIFKRLSATGHNNLPMGKLYPCLGEDQDQSGSGMGHYFYQDWLVAQEVFTKMPARHIDVGSRIDGFVAHVASFREIEVFDIRPLKTSVPTIRFTQMDLMSELGPSFRSICDSLSCLHALEHFGLGRYGDELDPKGHEKAFANLALMLKAGGTLYLSVPIGRSRVEFNAHRVFDLEGVRRLWHSQFSLSAFHYVDDTGELHLDQDFDQALGTVDLGLSYGCGIFELRKH